MIVLVLQSNEVLWLVARGVAPIPTAHVQDNTQGRAIHRDMLYSWCDSYLSDNVYRSLLCG